MTSPAANKIPTIADFVEWDITNWSRAIEFWMSHTAKDLAECRVLEIGSDYGGLSLWLASKGAQVACSDRNGPKPEARIRHEQAGLSHRVKYENVDALDIPYASEFDVVVMKSVIGIIGEPPSLASQKSAIRQIHKCLRPGGEFYFAENLAASLLHSYLRGRFVRWGSEWRYPTVPELLEMMAPFASVEYKTFGFAAAFGRSELQRHILDRLDGSLFDKIVPAHWNYIAAGVARK